MEPEGSLPHSQQPASVPILSQIYQVHASSFPLLENAFCQTLCLFPLPVSMVEAFCNVS
jgi:hypothetical protein